MSTYVINGRRASVGTRFLWAVLAAFLLMGTGCVNTTDPSGGLACSNGEAWVVTKSEARALFGEIMFAELRQGEYGFLLDDVDAVGIALKQTGEVVAAVQIRWTDALVETLAMMYIEEVYGGIIDIPQEMILGVKAMIFEMVGGKNKKGWYGTTTTGTTWRQSGNNLIFTSDSEDSEPIPFTISGNALTIAPEYEGVPVPVTLTKKTGINVMLFDELLEGLPQIPNIPGTGGDPDLILGEGQAWTYSDDDGWDEGYIFTSDGRFINIGRYEGGDWEIEDEGTYSAGNGNITVNYFGMSIPGTYSVSNNVL